MLYREYVTESLRLRGENKYLSSSWHDIVTTRRIDTRTGDEIAAEVIFRCGLTLKGGETI